MNRINKGETIGNHSRIEWTNEPMQSSNGLIAIIIFKGMESQKRIIELTLEWLWMESTSNGIKSGISVTVLKYKPSNNFEWNHSMEWMNNPLIYSSQIIIYESFQPLPNNRMNNHWTESECNHRSQIWNRNQWMETGSHHLRPHGIIKVNEWNQHQMDRESLNGIECIVIEWIECESPNTTSRTAIIIFKWNECIGIDSLAHEKRTTFSPCE